VTQRSLVVEWVIAPPHRNVHKVEIARLTSLKIRVSLINTTGAKDCSEHFQIDERPWPRPL